MDNDLILISKMINAGASQGQIILMREICKRLSKIGKKSKQEICDHTCLLIDKKAGKVMAEQSMKMFLKS